MSDHPGRGGHSWQFKDAVVEAVRIGGTVREVAANHGVSTASVWLWCKQAGLPPRKGLPPTCHPDRPVLAKRLCAPCYKAKYWQEVGSAA